ncbi:DUF1508 domain-containing protein [Zhouia sp. PK063]|uniref:DUF1508 domain-containing protein n=1 Tax=Zhouia sp. PK063 TaxID=3373602 RepID=UPI0037A21653
MGVFMINKTEKGWYETEFFNYKGKKLFNSICCKQKSDCLLIVQTLKSELEQFVIRKSTATSGKHIFRLSRGGYILGTSREFPSELSLNKAIDMTLKYVPDAEILDLPDESDVFL